MTGHYEYTGEFGVEKDIFRSAGKAAQIVGRYRKGLEFGVRTPLSERKPAPVRCRCCGELIIDPDAPDRNDHDDCEW